MNYSRLFLYCLFLLPLNSIGQFLPLPLNAESVFWNYAFTSQNSIGEEHVYFHGPSTNMLLDGKTYSPIFFTKYQINLLGNGTIDTIQSTGLLGHFRAESNGKIFKKEASDESLFFDVNDISIGDTIPSFWSIQFSSLSYSIILTNIDTLWDANNLPHRKFIFHIPQNPYLTELYFIDGIGCSASFLSFIPWDMESPMYDLGCVLIDSIPAYPSTQSSCLDIPPAPFTTLAEYQTNQLPYPNPCSGTLYLPPTFLSEVGQPIQVFNLNGSGYATTKIARAQLNLNEWESGNYILYFPRLGKSVKIRVEY